MNEYDRYEMSDDIGFTFGNCNLCGETINVVNSVLVGNGRLHATCKDPRAVHECVEDNQGLCHRCGRVLNPGRWAEYTGTFEQATLPKTWLVGEHNPYSNDPDNALYPIPEGATGARLCSTLGLDHDDYLRRFRRVNLLDQLPWSSPRARAAASDLIRHTGVKDKLVLLGARVAAAFRLDFAEHLLRPQFAGPAPGGTYLRTFLVVPHPSGKSRMWNDPKMQRRVREAVLLLDEIVT